MQDHQSTHKPSHVNHLLPLLGLHSLHGTGKGKEGTSVKDTQGLQGAMYIAYREVGAGALAGCSSVQVTSSVHIVVGAQGLTAAVLGCSRLLLLPHTPDSAWLPRGNTF